MAKKTGSADAAAAPAATTLASDQASARERVATVGRNDLCPCGSSKKYKKCHLPTDEAAAFPPAGPPDPMERVQAGWQMFEQRRPGAAEKEFRAALALKPDLQEAQVGVGLARLSAGDPEGAREALGVVITNGEGLLKDLREKNVTDGFSRREAQPVLRASHALGCLAFDEERYDEALVALERVYAVDSGPVGTEARLIAGKTLVKSGKPADAVAVLQDAAKSPHGPGRAHMGLALAHFLAGERDAATSSLQQALAANQHFGKAVLGQIRKQVDNPLGAPPGSREEAVVYAQTYGDAWDEPAKAFIGEVLSAAPAPAKSSEPGAGSEASAG
ncbi:MAG TPA: tetratricopeptide repeat protein [Polyangia bacterium]